jgi:uncharacterized membrane protein
MRKEEKIFGRDRRVVFIAAGFLLIFSLFLLVTIIFGVEALSLWVHCSENYVSSIGQCFNEFAPQRFWSTLAQWVIVTILLVVMGVFALNSLKKYSSDNSKNS